MKRFFPDLPLPLPTVSQVLWRSGCPADRAGSGVRSAVDEAIALLKRLHTSWSGAVFLEEHEIPPSLTGLFPGRPVTVMAASLGDGYETIIPAETGLSAFILDSAASVAVESLLKKLQTHLSSSLNMIATKRVAPGYGSLPLSVQADIVSMFPDSGLTCTEEYMLVPVKSTTGVTGWTQPEN